MQGAGSSGVVQADQDRVGLKVVVLSVSVSIEGPGGSGRVVLSVSGRFEADQVGSCCRCRVDSRRIRSGRMSCCLCRVERSLEGRLGSGSVGLDRSRRGVCVGPKGRLRSSQGRSEAGRVEGSVEVVGVGVRCVVGVGVRCIVGVGVR